MIFDRFPAGSPAGNRSDSDLDKRLRKPDRLRFKSDFDQVRQNGKKLVGSGMLAVYMPSPDQFLKCGAVCGKKYSLSAVKRNRARRLFFESFRLLKPHFVQKIHMILVPRRPLEHYKRQEVTRELVKLLARENLLSAEAVASPPEC